MYKLFKNIVALMRGIFLGLLPKKGDNKNV